MTDRPPDPSHRIAVIVPTYRRPDSLDRCLDALMAQEVRPYEILVAGPPCDESSRAVVDSHRTATAKFHGERDNLRSEALPASVAPSTG